MGGRKGGGKAPAPDANIGIAALKQAELGEKWLNFAETQFAEGNRRQKGIDKLENQIREQQIATQDQANTWSKEDRERYKSVFLPMEDKYIEDANNWDSEARQSQMAGEAKQDVMTSAAQAQQQNERQMASMGVDPRSGRFAGVDRGNDLSTALASAGAQNNARSSARTQGMAMRADAVNMGKGLPSQAAGAAGLGLSAGNSALGGALNANSAWQQNNGIMGQGYGGAMQGYAGQANTLSNLYGMKMQGWQSEQANSQANSAGLMSGIGTAAGLGLMAFSSKEYKENKRPADGALDAVNSMPVEQWKYKEGISDGGEHIGPYAEDFKNATGKGDGKTINLMDGIGITMKAVQELDQKLDRIAGSKKKNGKKEATA